MSTIRYLSIRRLLIVLAVLLGTSAPAASMTAAPIVRPDGWSWYRYSYYSDSTLSTQVGSEYFPCAGSSNMEWGYRTQYVRIYEDSCQ